MSPVSPARRRAEEFASLLEGRGDAAHPDDRFSDALEVVTALRSIPTPAPSAAYVADLRASLMAAADTLLVPTDARLTLPARTASRSRTRDRRIAIAVGTLALLGSSTGVAMAARNALPGDSLYPVKRVLESAQTALSSDDQARADRIMGLASGRLDEAHALALRDSAESQAAIPQTLEDFVAQASQAADALLGEYAESGDPATVDELRGFTKQSLDVLAGLKTLVPAEFADAFDTAVNALLSIDEQVLAACGTCGDLLDIPPILLSGAEINPPTTPRTTAAPRAAATPRTADPITELLGNLPKVGATTPTPDATVSTSPSPSPSTSSSGGLGTVVTTDSPVTEPLTDPLGDLLDPLLDPLLGPDGLL